ncbi:tyrosine-protein phosphatase [Bombilactobacillus thymidiniphilus]|uniref:Tyrosine-protein phosphatase n=1 Tax=Bombilactobacillus thymidiniphilus TaxID=2923363 RepID=A0ABY4PBT7_9LACO|nr:tyrosine-protein phosphatase [Bombilactobacillus thymidiniphilus]UQS83080.1 tyrosine-protein phosphatase [Bombilactobacillus thymidiniphilus]
MQNERLLNIKSGMNFRELGGYKNKEGRQLKYHKLVRSASLGNLSDSDLQYLTDYGVRYDIDFRSIDEQKSVPDKVPDQAEYIFDPVFDVDLTQASKFNEQEEQDQGHKLEGVDRIPADGNADMLETYHDLINLDSSKKAYRLFFDKLLANDQDGQAVLFHCTAGKDRTGMGAIFVLTALDVDRDTIIQDYLLTNQASKPFIDDQIKQMQQKKLDPNLITSVKALLAVKTDYLQAADAAVQKTSGTWQNYLRTELKVTDSEIKQLQAIYLD